MIEVAVHYVAGGDNLSETSARDHQARIASFARVPSLGETISAPDGRGVELVLQVAFSKDGTPHIFVVPTLAGPNIQQAFGLADGGSPSLTAFKGKTIADLQMFLSEYPADAEVLFQNRGILVAKSKVSEVYFRLDDPED